MVDIPEDPDIYNPENYNPDDLIPVEPVNIQTRCNYCQDNTYIEGVVVLEEGFYTKCSICHTITTQVFLC